MGTMTETQIRLDHAIRSYARRISFSEVEFSQEDWWWRINYNSSMAGLTNQTLHEDNIGDYDYQRAFTDEERGRKREVDAFMRKIPGIQYKVYLTQGDSNWVGLTISVDKARSTMAKKTPQTAPKEKDKGMKITLPPSTPRDPAAKALGERGGTGGGAHHNRGKDVAEGRSRKEKHKKDWRDKEADEELPMWGTHAPLSLRPDYGKGHFQRQADVRPGYLEVVRDGGLILIEPGWTGRDRAVPLDFKRGQILELSRDKRLRVYAPDARGSDMHGWVTLVHAWNPDGKESQTLDSLTRPISSADFNRKKMMIQSSYDGNKNGKPIYPVEIDHGYDIPLAGGTDVMQHLQNNLLREQGTPELGRRIARKLALRYLASVASR